MKKKKKTGLLSFSRLESLLIIALSIVFLFWAGLKCKNSKMDLLSPKPKTEASPERINPNPSPKTKTLPDTKRPSNTEVISLPKQTSIPLYVHVDSLKVRIAPHLDSAIVTKIPLGQSIEYLNERTEFKQQINMNNIVHNEPWIKVKTKKGQVGWVYRAGVEFYK